ncbi:MAG: CPBP family intramembrane glutamic endopeptidase [Bacteroidota bacterium]
MKNQKKWNAFLLCSPILVLLIAREGIEILLPLVDFRIAWLPCILVYYGAIGLSFFFAKQWFEYDLSAMSLSWRPLPHLGLLLFTIILPGLSPLGVTLDYGSSIPSIYFLYIFVFAFINAPIEELYWRGLLSTLPGGPLFRNFYTAALFSFSHYFLWGYWFNSLYLIIPVLIVTFLMGLLYMHFVNRTHNLLYPILSHILVDILNLSVAVYCGLVVPVHY